MASSSFKDSTATRLPQVQSSTSSESVRAIEDPLPLTRVSGLSAEQQVRPLGQLDPIQAAPSVVSLDTETEVDAQETKRFFESLISEQGAGLTDISHKVQSGLLSPKEAERELLIIALMNSLNVPRQLALTALPRLEESLSQAAELRADLHSLWTVKDRG